MRLLREFDPGLFLVLLVVMFAFAAAMFAAFAAIMARKAQSAGPRKKTLREYHIPDPDDEEKARIMLMYGKKEDLLP